MNRHQIVIEVNPDPDGLTGYALMLHLVDEAEDEGWVVTDAFVREVAEDD